MTLSQCIKFNPRTTKLEKNLADIGNIEGIVEVKLKSVKEQAEDNKKHFSTRLNQIEDSCNSQIATITRSLNSVTNDTSISSELSLLKNKTEDIIRKMASLSTVPTTKPQSFVNQSFSKDSFQHKETENAVNIVIGYLFLSSICKITIIVLPAKVMRNLRIKWTFLTVTCKISVQS